MKLPLPKIFYTGTFQYYFRTKLRLQIPFRRQKTMENLEKRNRELEMARVKNKDIIQCEQRQQVSQNTFRLAFD